MQTINDLLENPISTSTAPTGATTSAPRSITVDDRQFVNGIFKTLQAIFPAWRQAFPTDESLNEAKRQWALGLIEAKLTNAEMINAGLAMARKSKNPFIPSIGQFVDWCIEAKLRQVSFPTLDSVIAKILHYASNRKSSAQEFLPEIDPYSYWIFQHVDMYAVRHADAKECRRLVSITYDEAVERAAAGVAFDAPPVLIAEQSSLEPQSEDDRLRAKRTIENLKSMLRGAA